jgi:nitrogenase-stabilizing/protective protein
MDDELPDPRVRYREALRRAYTAFTTAGALDHRVFRVLQERAPRNFVPLHLVAVEGDAR